MKFPCLVRPRFCKTPVYVALYGEGVTEDGAPEIICENTYNCNYQETVKTVFTEQQKKVQVNGVILIPDDIAPEHPTISGGFVEIFGARREIIKATKARNPDGTVNFTELDVI